jgi:nucleoside-diphosphate-sugar epimerase
VGHEVVGLSRRRPRGSPASAWVEVDIGTPAAATQVTEALPRCEAIVHAAASLDRDPGSPSLVLVNCLGTQQMLRLAELWSADGFLYVSGVPVIGIPRVLPISEDHPADPTTAYHASKLFGEHLVRLAARHATILRLTAPVGPTMPEERILSVFVRRAIAGEPLEVAGTGERRQDYVDVRDVGRAVSACVEQRAQGCFNVARGKSISNIDLARRCVEVLESRSSVNAGRGIDPEEGLSWDVSIARAATDFGYAPSYDIEDSIRSIADSVAG